MHDPESLLFDRFGFQVWHVDPCKDGSDDSCGIFMRSRHGDSLILQKIIRQFAFDWDGGFGWYDEKGELRYSTIAATLSMFWVAALCVFGSRRKTERYLKKNFLDIVFFAENLHDSIGPTLKRKYQSKDEKIEDVAHIIYGYILRTSRPWWKHPRFHLHHWKVVFEPFVPFKRWLFSRCAHCGKGFAYREYPVTGYDNYDGGPKWFRSEKGVYHSACYSLSHYRKP